MEQPDGTFVAWAGPDESVGVDYVEDTPEHAQAAAMFALKRKSGHDRMLDSVFGRSRCGRIRCWLEEGGREVVLWQLVKRYPMNRLLPILLLAPVALGHTELVGVAQGRGLFVVVADGGGERGGFAA